MSWYKYAASSRWRWKWPATHHLRSLAFLVTLGGLHSLPCPASWCLGKFDKINIIYESYYRGFSSDVISSQFCKSLYLLPPCLFPLSMAWYRKKQQNVQLRFNLVHTTIPNYNRVTRNISTHTLGGNFESFCKVNQKFQRFLLFFSIPRHTKGNQAAGKNHACIGAHRVVQTLNAERIHTRTILPPPLGFLFEWRGIEENNKTCYYFWFTL